MSMNFGPLRLDFKHARINVGVFGAFEVVFGLRYAPRVMDVWFAHPGEDDIG